MKEEYREMELYRETFSEVHAPDALKGKVKDMANNKRHYGQQLLRNVLQLQPLRRLCLHPATWLPMQLPVKPGSRWLQSISMEKNYRLRKRKRRMRNLKRIY